MGTKEAATRKVNKSDYEIHQYLSGYFGIVKKDTYAMQPVWGGDSACEDHYECDILEAVFEKWDGTLIDCGDEKYGEDGFIIENI